MLLLKETSWIGWLVCVAAISIKTGAAQGSSIQMEMELEMRWTYLHPTNASNSTHIVLVKYLLRDGDILFYQTKLLQLV